MYKDSYSVKTHLKNLFLHQYEHYLPTAFDESLSLVQKMNELIKAQDALIDVVNTHVQFTSDQIERAFDIIDVNLDRELTTFRAELDEQKRLYEEIRDKIHSDLLPDSVKQKLEEWLLNGTIEELINDVIFSDITEKIEYVENRVQALDQLAVSIEMFISPQEAVKHAYDNNLNLDWGNKHHVITGNLPNFNDIKHYGYGSIEVDGQTFYLNPQPGNKNTIFVRENGNDNNMGISPVKAFSTLQKAFNILRGRSELLSGEWVIDIGPGTYGGARLTGVESQIALKIIGHVNPTTNQPETILSGTIPGGTGGNFGIRMEPATKDMVIENIMFSKFNATSTSYGFLMKSHGKTTLKNCRAYDCTIGFACVNSGVIIVSETVAKRCDTGFTVSYGGSGTFGGPGGLFGTGNGSQALECVTGVSVTRNAVAHVDYMEIEDCTFAGVDVNMSSRVHVLGSHFKRNKIGVDASGSSEWINNTNPANHFYENTVNENEVNYGHFGVSRESRLYSQRSTNEFRTYSETPEFELTGSTNRTTVIATPSSYFIPEYFLKYKGRKIRIVVTGRYTGTGQKTINLVLQNITPTGGTGVGTDTIHSFNYPNDSTGRPFKFDIEVDTMGDDRAVLSGVLNVHLATFSYAKSNITTLADTSLRKQLRVTAELSDPTDTIHVDKVEMYVAG